MTILFLADPTSIHDMKWMRFFSKEHNVFVVCRAPHMSKIKQKHLDNMQDENLQFLGSIADFSVVRPWVSLQTKKQLKQIITRHSVDIFHMLFAEPNVLWARYGSALGAKLVLTTRGTDVLKTIPRIQESPRTLHKVLSRFYAQAFSRLDAITSTSVQQTQALSTFTLKTKPQVIRTGIDVESFSVEEPPHPDLENKQYLFFPRLMQPLYNHELCIEALIELEKLGYKGLHAVFLNKDSNNQNYVEKIQDTLGKLQHIHVHFFETVSPQEMRSLNQHAAAVVMTPKSDGSPVSAMEAMGARTPLVVPPLDYDEQLFKYVFKLADWESSTLVSALKTILAGEDKERTQQNYTQVLKFGNRATEMKKLESVYKQLLSSC